MMRIALATILAVGLCGCGTPTDELTMAVRQDDGGVLEGFGCRSGTAARPGAQLVDRLADSSGHVYLVIDVIRVRGAQPSGPGSLFDLCNPNIRDHSQPVPTGDARECQIAAEKRTCVDVDFTEVVRAATGSELRPRRVSLDVLRELGSTRALAHLDEPGAVMLRVVGSTDAPSVCTRTLAVRVDADGGVARLDAEPSPPSPTPEASISFRDESLVGCAFSMPTRIGQQSQTVELGLDINALDTECYEREVLACANGITPP